MSIFLSPLVRPRNARRFPGALFVCNVLRRSSLRSASARRMAPGRPTSTREFVSVCVLAVAGLAVLSAVSGCAKVGEPQPPIILIPKPAADLAASQVGNAVVLSVSMPAENTNGSPVTTLQQVEVLRLSSSRGQITGPLSENEFKLKAELILTVAADRFSAYLHDKTFVFKDEFSLQERDAIYGRTYDYSVRFVNRKLQTAGIGNQAIISPVAIPAPPGGLTTRLTQEYVRLTWEPPTENMDRSTPPRIAGYNVYRSEDPKRFPPAPLNPEPLPKPEYEDRSIQFDKTYYYAVSVVGSRANPHAESIASPPVQVVARDVFAPEPPQNLNAVVENGVVILLWVAPREPDVAGYRVYRREEEREQQLLQPAPVSTLSFRDEKVQAGKKYEYFVTALDTHGNESTSARISVEVP